MQYYFAPMEGITGYPFRNTFEQFFGGADRYYSPFLVANQHKSFKKKELRDVAPENNRGITLIPQILTNQAELFVWAVRFMAELGYQEVNLNLGCPSAAVVNRHRGAGLLADTDFLDRFLEEVFEALPDGPKVSVKTRIGMADLNEAERLTDIYRRYPFSEVIIHPRLREEFYQGSPHREVFAEMLAQIGPTAVYNGDLNTAEEVLECRRSFPEVNAVMIGRGALRNPALFREARAAEDGGADTPALKKAELRAFVEALFAAYRPEMADDRQVMFKMKEIWSYLQVLFPDAEKPMKKLRKAKSLADYQAFLEEIFQKLR